MCCTSEIHEFNTPKGIAISPICSTDGFCENLNWIALLWRARPPDTLAAQIRIISGIYKLNYMLIYIMRCCVVKIDNAIAVIFIR